MLIISYQRMVVAVMAPSTKPTNRTHTKTPAIKRNSIVNINDSPIKFNKPVVNKL